MSSYVKFVLDDETAIYLEAAETHKGSGSLIPSRGEPGGNDPTNLSFEQSVDSVQKMAVMLINGLRNGFVEKPSEIAVSFGLKASAELESLVVARAGMDANFNISLRWHKERDLPKPDKDDVGESINLPEKEKNDPDEQEEG